MTRSLPTCTIQGSCLGGGKGCLDLAEGGPSTCARSQASSVGRRTPPHKCNPPPICQVINLTALGGNILFFCGEDGGRVFPGCVSGCLAKRGELQNCSEEPEATSLSHGTQVKCSRFRDLQGPTTTAPLKRTKLQRICVQCKLDETFNTGKSGTSCKAGLAHPTAEGAPQPEQR